MRPGARHSADREAGHQRVENIPPADVVHRERAVEVERPQTTPLQHNHDGLQVFEGHAHCELRLENEIIDGRLAVT